MGFVKLLQSRLVELVWASAPFRGRDAIHFRITACLENEFAGHVIGYRQIADPGVSASGPCQVDHNAGGSLAG